MISPFARAALLLSAGIWMLGCAHGPEVHVPALKIPASFPNQTPGASAGTLHWSSYFADPALKELIGAALAANPDLHIALQRIELARASVHERTGRLFPSVAFGAGVGITKYGRYTADGAGNATTEIRPGQIVPENLQDYNLGLQTSWELDLWGKLRNARGSAVASYLATIEGTRFVVTSLIADVASSYFELVALDRTRAVLTETVERQKQVLEVVRLQKEAGRANELAVQQFEAQLASTNALKATMELRAKQTENSINLLRGSFAGPVTRTEGTKLPDVPPGIAAGVPSDLLQNRPDVREAERQLEAAKCDVKAARAAFFPSFTIGGGVGFQAFNPKFLFETPASLVYSATLGLIAPLVNRSAIEAEFRAAKALQVQAMYNYQKVILNAYVEVANGLLGLERNAEIVALKRQQRKAVEQTVESADMLYRAGKASYFEVLIAQQNTLAADLELIEAERDQRLASVTVYKALGGGWRE